MTTHRGQSHNELGKRVSSLQKPLKKQAGTHQAKLIFAVQERNHNFKKIANKTKQ